MPCSAARDARGLGPAREAPGAEEQPDADGLAELGPGPEAREGARRLREPPGADGASPERAHGLRKGLAEDGAARAADGARRFRELLGEEEAGGSGDGRYGGDGYAAGARARLCRAGCPPGARPGPVMGRLQAAAARRGARRGLPPPGCEDAAAPGLLAARRRGSSCAPAHVGELERAGRPARVRRARRARHALATSRWSNRSITKGIDLGRLMHLGSS